MIRTNCPLCGKDKYHLYLKVKHTKYYRCQLCKLIFAKKLPRNSYQDYNLNHFVKWEGYLKNVFRKEAKGIKKYKNKGSVLEIGIGMGYMMEILKEFGFSVVGIEPSEKLVSLARKKGLIVKKGYFEKVSKDLGRFDVVILSHVLEHIQNPNLFLKKVKKVLKNDGILLIQVPNFGSFEAQILKSHWPYLVPDDHYIQFTHQTLQQLMKKNNLEIVEADTTGTFTELDDILEEIWRCLKGDQKRLIYYLITWVPAIIERWFNEGSALRYIVRL